MSDHVYAQDEIFAAVRLLLKKYHAERAILFGSYARQEANAASDIDLIVVGGSKFDPTDVFCIAPWESPWTCTNCGNSMPTLLFITR